MTNKAQAHLVFVPFPVIGHLVSTIQLAKFLVDRLYITILLINSPSNTVVRDYTHSLASSSLSERTHVIILEPHIPTTSHSNIGSYMTALIENTKPNVKEAVSNLVGDISSPPLAAFVVDMFCTTMIDVAGEFRVPALLYFTSGVAFLGLMLHLHTLRERDNVDATELKDTDTELVIPSFANPDGIIVNSFEELESYAVHSFSDADNPIYPVGPILHINGNKDGDSDIIKWLDDQPPSSVVFLCFGSMGSLDEDQVREIARALEECGARFLWSLRKPPPKDSMGTPSDYTPQELTEVLPDGFLDRTAQNGRVIGWAPRAQVLAHRAAGGFVSHCGWHSTLESIYFGVPIATWPLYAEQQTNAFQLVRELNMAVEIVLDYRVDFMFGRNTLLSADKIEKGIRDVLEKDGEVRKKVKEMSDKSSKTLTQGGCSYSYLGRLIDYLMNHV